METIETDVAVMVFNSDFHWFDADPKAFVRVQATVLANEVDFDPDADPWLLARLPQPKPDRRQALTSALPTSVRWLFRLALMGALAPCMAAAAILAPLAGSPGSLPPEPWVVSGLPGQTIPVTRFVLERQDVGTVLRVQTAASYGYLVHALKGVPAGWLSWRWRVDKALASPDLRRPEGDDVALKVCVLFDMPRSAVPFVERQLLRLAESRSGESLPTATVCYAWDPSWPEGTVVPNVYSRRVRYITLGSKAHSWQSVQRDLAADFVRAFGDETTSVPKVLAIALGADADNTRGESLGFIADLDFTPGGWPRRE